MRYSTTLPFIAVQVKGDIAAANGKPDECESIPKIYSRGGRRGKVRIQGHFVESSVMNPSYPSPLEKLRPRRKAVLCPRCDGVIHARARCFTPRPIQFNHASYFDKIKTTIAVGVGRMIPC